MALYSVERTDVVAPGEFTNALVLAAGAALARSCVEHMSGVQKGGKNVKATRVDVAKSGGGAVLLAAYWDEREPEPAAGQDTLPFEPEAI